MELVNQIKDLFSFLDPKSAECKKFVRKHKDELEAYFSKTWSTPKWPSLTKQDSGA